ncbi:MAG: hypothetical protein JO286_01140 [Solirubrobacterales bacterium]|nr:hypothetical protein [Solirubrobacterales bacterium]MBV9368044.1 hypothetical protein [Solirubrobacterales bacterium]MBV9684889.1 hypothetical protein [Solirubrobacterales bacterium]MBV9805750.1 hypothetical protein [Solirubrobacterales bacterium]
MELEDFLAELHRLLEEVAYQGEGLLPAYLLPLLREAWPEVEVSFTELERAVASGEHEQELSSRGLRGAQFRLKAEGFRRHLLLFRRHREPRWLKKLLKWADVILGSLVAIIPGGDAAKEFKEAVEAGAEDMDDGSAGETDAVPAE